MNRNKIRSSFILGVSILTIGLTANAQATRTWVSGTGDDTNFCSRTAPCKTWAGAIAKTAPGGEIDALDPGGFGTLVITGPITIDGGGGQVASTLAPGSNGLIIDAPGASVTLRNISIQGIAQSGLGGTNGITLVAAAALHIEKCLITGFTQNGINLDVASGTQVFIDDTTSQDNVGAGLLAQGSTGGTAGQVHVSISNSHFSNNATGVLGGQSAAFSIRSSDATGNKGAGFQLSATNYSATMSIADSTSANNVGAGIAAGGGNGNAVVRISNNSIFSNGSGYSIGTKGSIISFGNNANTGSGAPTSTIKLD